ncbi:unnamed protein product [Owenia fusiformis]|uniref:Transporter n=1 Tax=Owenia fusiformis TaxID=6347 RepID=A0A8J1UXW5_OWEFU|nr:unnamed protein product [Owenia fusiformis]
MQEFDRGDKHTEGENSNNYPKNYDDSEIDDYPRKSRDYPPPPQMAPYSTQPSMPNEYHDDNETEVIFETDENKHRGNWSNCMDFILAVLGMNVGLGNIWRFPYLVYNNGGGAFLVPYVIMMILVGIPLTLLELGLGQFCSRGSPAAWNCVPVFRGIGFAGYIAAFLLMIYYNMVLGWGIYYLVNSFTFTLPWSTCENAYNSKGCNSTYSSAEFNNYMFAGFPVVNADITNIGYPQWPLIFCLLASWMLVFLSMLKGIKSSGKVVYFTALFPYAVLIALLVIACLQDGYIDGINYYIKVADWDKLKEPQIWKDAASQIFFSLSMSGASLIGLSSYNKFHNNVVRDTLFASIGNCLTSFFAGFVVFAFIGTLAHKTGNEVQDVATAGPGLIFVVYPQAFDYLPVPHVWNILFFIMVITLGFDSVFGVIEGIATAIVDEFPRLHKYKVYVVVMVCIIGFAAGIPLTCPGGGPVLGLMDYYAVPYAFMICGFFESIAVAWFYGASRFAEDIYVMVGHCFAAPLFMICWWVVTPCVILFAFISEAIDKTDRVVGNEQYPDWVVGIGWVIAMISVVFIPLVAIYQFVKECLKGKSLLKSLETITNPTPDWGPALKIHRQEVANAAYVKDFVVSPRKLTELSQRYAGADNMGYYPD